MLKYVPGGGNPETTHSRGRGAYPRGANYNPRDQDYYDYDDEDESATFDSYSQPSGEMRANYKV